MGEPDVAKMTRRTTQRALYTSLLSIVACALMLFGTTFAWFSASTTSGANTLTAANFDVDVSATSLDAGIHTVTLTRLGGGSAPGYCQFTLTMSGTYVQTTTVTYSDGSSQQGEPTQQTLNDTQLCRANFSEGIETISFTLSLTNATASIAELSSSWGSCTEGDGVMLRSRSAQPAAMEITDGETIEFGMEDQEVECAATLGLWYMEQSASQGNEYAQFFIDRQDSLAHPDVMLAVTRLLYDLSKVFQQNSTPQTGHRFAVIDRKRRREMLDKRIAMGHREDDHEDAENYKYMEPAMSIW